MLSEFAIIGITLLAAVIAAVAQYLFKRSVPKFGFSKKGIRILILNKGIWAGGVIYLISLVVYLKALGSGQLSFVYPTFASTFVFITLISHFVLKEDMNMKRVAGIALIVIGIAVVALSY
jgi:uncharacterized membrane protein